MALIDIARAVADQVGFDRPPNIINSNDITARQILAFANLEGINLSRAHNWTILCREHVFATVSGQAEYALPSDFDRLIDNTWWDKANYESLRGPLNPAEWQRKKNSIFGQSQRQRDFRIRRGTGLLVNRFFIDPVPSASGEQIVFEYVSNQWVRDTDGATLRNKWGQDSDVPLLDENLISMGVVWRFKESKGLPYATQVAEYENERRQAMGRDGSAPILDMNPSRYLDTSLLGNQNIKEGSWP
ncbi:hypothetical protein UFOVP413_23 [uncultured Caudovirales phage]|uniref:Uncharacterized protein n=1 Tax=uncultured Caudovirales phage TaxID=2100421 RepID=A0A6J5M7F2_9CAUD|nr:hypothetical protein UFOVP413_23 [uncultured Caudovirales phage]